MTAVRERAKPDAAVAGVWERMLEIEFVDRSVALAGKAFVSFFPLVIVVAAFVPERIRTSIITAVTARLGGAGDALATAREAFASSEDIRKATGVLGLVLTIFFATSFTTALHRVYLHRVAASPRREGGWVLEGCGVARRGADLHGSPRRASRRARRRSPARAVRPGLAHGDDGAVVVHGLVPAARRGPRRVFLPAGVVTAVAMSAFALSATVWMPGVVTRNQAQFGFFGVALALVTWFSGAAICILIGACAGAVFASDSGNLGTLIRGRDQGVLVDGAEPSLPPPARQARLIEAFRPTEDDVGT